MAKYVFVYYKRTHKNGLKVEGDRMYSFEDNSLTTMEFYNKIREHLQNTFKQSKITIVNFQILNE